MTNKENTEMATLSITIYYGGPGKPDASGRRPVHHAGEIPHLGQVYTPQPLTCTPGSSPHGSNRSFQVLSRSWLRLFGAAWV